MTGTSLPRVRPAVEPNRETALAKMKAAIRAKVPEYSESELRERAKLWVARALKSGAIVISEEAP